MEASFTAERIALNPRLYFRVLLGMFIDLFQQLARAARRALALTRLDFHVPIHPRVPALKANRLKRIH